MDDIITTALTTNGLNMDATKRPLHIPPKFGIYAEQHGIFDMYKRLLEQLIIHKPNDPVEFMIRELKKDNDDIPRTIVLGPPASGKKSIAKMISQRTKAIYLTQENLVEDAETALKEEARGYLDENKKLPIDLYVKLIEERVKLFDCIKKGWVLAGFPTTREETMALQARGIHPKHVVKLDAHDTALIERAAGKRVDPRTGDIYHTTFDWPTTTEISSRLVEVAGNSEEDIVEKLVFYHRNIDHVTVSFKKISHTINADQPKADVFAQTMTFLNSKHRSPAPHTPRVVLIGPTGSGKGVQAALLANKYNIVNVSCGQIVKQAMADETAVGNACKPYIERKMMVPDAILLKVLMERLGQLDCVSRGWVLHGYPRTREQAEQLSEAGYIPNRVFILDVPNDSIVERLTLRATDPITGDRYHLLYNPPRTQEVKDRLLTHPVDSEEEVKKRLAQFSAYRDDIVDYYEDAQRINADQDPHTVFESIESVIVNPLPSKED